FYIDDVCLDAVHGGAERFEKHRENSWVMWREYSIPPGLLRGSSRATIVIFDSSAATRSSPESSHQNLRYRTVEF
ncbi:MAG: hypothetical protein ABI164_04940, partial [Acidobacteriaceae bacterium]